MDDPEFEITPLGQGPSSDLQQRSRFPGPRMARRGRLALAAASVFVVLAVLLSVWLPLHSVEPTVLGYPSPTPLPTASPVLLPTPLPVTGHIGAPPQNCPSAPALDSITVPAFDGFIGGTVPLSGRAPVWVPYAQFNQGFVDLSPPSAPPYWPSAEMFWAIGPHRYPSVTVRAFALDTGEIAWWGGDKPQVPVLVMNPALDYPTAVSWVTYRMLLFMTHAGCYELQVSWDGGGWYTIFAAGQPGTAPPA